MASESIRVYALNRHGLVRARQAHALRVLKRIACIKDLTQTLDGIKHKRTVARLEHLILEETAQLEAMKEDDQPYAQLTRQLIAAFKSELRRSSFNP